MSKHRKLQQEVEACLKRIKEQADDWEELWGKMGETREESTQREKFIEFLKRDLKKLQRLREQVRGWLADSSVTKGQDEPLLEARARVERLMERFKDLERDNKMKAFSRAGLQRDDIDPAVQAKCRCAEWLSDVVVRLETQIEQLEAELEEIGGGGKGKGKGGAASGRAADLRAKIERHQEYVAKVERTRRLLENEEVTPEEVESALHDSLEYFIEANDEDNFIEDEGMWEMLPQLEEVDEGVGKITVHHKKEAATKEAAAAAEAEAAAAAENSAGEETIFAKEDGKGSKGYLAAAATPSDSASLPPTAAPAGPKLSFGGTAVPPPGATKCPPAVGAPAAELSKGPTPDLIKSVSAGSAATRLQEAEVTLAAEGPTEAPAPLPSAATPPLPAWGLARESSIARLHQMQQKQQEKAEDETHTPASAAPSSAAAPPAGKEPSPPLAPSPPLSATPLSAASITPPQQAQQRAAPVPEDSSETVVPAPSPLELRPPWTAVASRSVASGSISAGSVSTAAVSTPAAAALAGAAVTASESASSVQPEGWSPFAAQSRRVFTPDGGSSSVEDITPSPETLPTLSAPPIPASPFKPLGAEWFIGQWAEDLEAQAGAGTDEIAAGGSTPPAWQAHLVEMSSDFRPIIGDDIWQTDSSQAPNRTCAWHPIHPAATPLSYPNNVHPTLLHQRSYQEALPQDALFFAFYFMPGTRQQLFAAAALKAQGWRFHTQLRAWFARTGQPANATDAYEEGSMAFFDPGLRFENGRVGGWTAGTTPANFRFDYTLLENENLSAPSG